MSDTNNDSANAQSAEREQAILNKLNAKSGDIKKVQQKVDSINALIAELQGEVSDISTELVMSLNSVYMTLSGSDDNSLGLCIVDTDRHGAYCDYKYSYNATTNTLSKFGEDDGDNIE